MALLLFGEQGGRVEANDAPMSGQGEVYIADPEASDDEPAAPAPPPPVEKAAPALHPGKVMTPYPATAAPLPPRRPFSEQAVQAPPEASPQPEGATQDEGPGEAEAAPSEAQKVSAEALEAEEAKAPEPVQVDKQTEAVNIACLKPALMDIVQRAGKFFGATPVITSGQRFRGRRGSYHRKCMAADFIIPGVERTRLARYLRAQADAGGVGTYCHTKAVHIDVGEPRNWYQCGFRFRFAQR